MLLCRQGQRIIKKMIFRPTLHEIYVIYGWISWRLWISAFFNAACSPLLDPKINYILLTSFKIVWYFFQTGCIVSIYDIQFKAIFFMVCLLLMLIRLTISEKLEFKRLLDVITQNDVTNVASPICAFLLDSSFVYI